jgi:hypothetical protein
MPDRWHLMFTAILGNEVMFVALSSAALVSTFIVAIGLYLEYERHELRVLSVSKTTKLKSRCTAKFNRPVRKGVGGFLVVVGVVLEFVFGFTAFISATIRENQNEIHLADANRRAADAVTAAEKEKLARLNFGKEYGPRQLTDTQRNQLSKYWHKYAGRTVMLRGLWDPETDLLADELSEALTKAGLIVKRDLNPPTIHASGIVVEGPLADFSTLERTLPIPSIALAYGHTGRQHVREGCPLALAFQSKSS